jgi:hypothetical protein
MLDFFPIVFALKTKEVFHPADDLNLSIFIF